MTTAKSLIKGSIFRSFNFAISIMISFFMMPFLIHNLGDKWYGFWTLVATFVGYYGFLDLGLASATGRFLARAVGRNDTQEINIVVNTSFYAYNYIALASIMVTIMIICGAIFSMESSIERLSFLWCIFFVGLSFSLSVSVRAFSGILSAYLRYDISAIIDFIMLILKNVSIVVVVCAGYKIVAISAVTLLMSIVEIGCIYYMVKKVFPELEICRRYVHKNRIKDLFNYGGFTFIAQIADHLRFNVDNFVISAFLGVNAVTFYAIPSRLAQYFIQLVVQALGMMTPVFSRYEGNNDYESIRKKFVFLTKLSMIFVLPIGYTILFVGKAFITRWMGSQYEHTYLLLVVFIVPLMIALMQTPSVGVLYGISKHKFYALFNSFEGVVNLVLSLVLVNKYGLLGVALGTAIPMLFIKIFIQPIYVTRCIQLSVGVYVILLVRILGLFLFMAGLLSIFLTKYLVPNYLSLFTIGVIGCAAIWCFLFFMVFNKEEKAYFYNVIRNKIKTVKND